MHHILMECEKEFNAGLQERWFELSNCKVMCELANKLSAYPIIYNNNGQKCNGLIVFMVFDVGNREVLPMHKVVEQKKLDYVADRVNLQKAKILSEVILGDHELNIIDDIAELEDYDHYYECLVEDGAIVDQNYDRCKEIDQAISAIKNEEGLIGKINIINQLGVSKFQIVINLIKAYVS